MLNDFLWLVENCDLKIVTGHLIEKHAILTFNPFKSRKESTAHVPSGILHMILCYQFHKNKFIKTNWTDLLFLFFIFNKSFHSLYLLVAKTFPAFSDGEKRSLSIDLLPQSIGARIGDEILYCLRQTLQLNTRCAITFWQQIIKNGYRIEFCFLPLSSNASMWLSRTK